MAALIGQVGSLQNDVATLKSVVSSLQSKVTTLGNSVLNLKGQNNWAVVDSSANVVRHSGVSQVTAVRMGKGTYDVTFSKKDVTGCAYTATIGDVGTAFVAPGFITVSGGGKTVNDIGVQTFDKDGGPADSAFHLYVSCP